jgi:hypothetical protein
MILQKQRKLSIMLQALLAKDALISLAHPYDHRSLAIAKTDFMRSAWKLDSLCVTLFRHDSESAVGDLLCCLPTFSKLCIASHFIYW